MNRMIKHLLVIVCSKHMHHADYIRHSYCSVLMRHMQQSVGNVLLFDLCSLLEWRPFDTSKLF